MTLLLKRYSKFLVNKLEVIKVTSINIIATVVYQIKILPLHRVRLAT
jgi:hypothetical protein